MADEKYHLKRTLINLSVRTYLSLLFLSFIFFLFLITKGINFPYVGYNAWNFNTYSLIARNFNMFGYFETRLAPVISVSQSLPEKPKLYLHHPQLLSIIESVFFKIFGEQFWVGRLAVILFSAGSFILMVLLASSMSGRMYAALVAITASLIPANAVFGRMIGMEPLVLFFALLSVFLTIRFFKKRSRYVYLLIHTSVILGVLSDWPMVYFSFFLMILCFFKKNKRLGLSIFLTALITEGVFLLYVYAVIGSFSDMISAIVQRSAGELVTLSYWPAIWIVTIALRLVLYFNPIFLFFSLAFLFLASRKLYLRDYSDKYLLSLLFFLFGFLNVLFFPEGSFGHAYWIYYFVPFVVFGSSEILSKILEKKRYLLMTAILVFSVMFVLKIVDWKTKEIAVNIWRYELGKQVSNYIPAYEKILLNEQSAIDPDLYQYAFRYEFKNIDPKMINNFANNYSFYAHSCVYQCNKGEIRQLLDAFEHKKLVSSQAEAYVFFLQIPKKNVKATSEEKPAKVTTTTLPENSGLTRLLYQKIVKILHLPQL